MYANEQSQPSFKAFTVIIKRTGQSGENRSTFFNSSISAVLILICSAGICNSSIKVCFTFSKVVLSPLVLASA